MSAAFRIADVVAALRRTPDTLGALLHDLPGAWADARPDGEGWSAREILAHLVHGERTDWLVRARTILEHGEARAFEPFDRRAHLRAAPRTVQELLHDLARLRARNLEVLEALQLDAADLGRTGTHPELGRVTLQQLLAAWVVHDLGHLRQVARVLAKRHAEEVGPWRAYLPVLDEQGGDSGDPAPPP